MDEIKKPDISSRFDVEDIRKIRDYNTAPFENDSIRNCQDFKPHKLRVAAYARVSTEQDEQESSYEAQVDRFSEKPLVF